MGKYLAILLVTFLGWFKWPFQWRIMTSNIWGSKGHGLNHLVDVWNLDFWKLHPNFPGCETWKGWNIVHAALGIDILTTQWFWAGALTSAAWIITWVVVSMRLKNMVALLMEEIRLTTWDEKSLVHTGIIYLSTGAGFLPSRVCPQILSSSNVGLNIHNIFETHHLL